MKVWAVETGCYSDYRIDSLWSTKELAEQRAALLKEDAHPNDPVDVAGWAVDDPAVGAERLTWVVTAYLNRNDGTMYRPTSGPRANVSGEPHGVRISAPHPTSIAGLRGECYLTVRSDSEERALKVLSEQVAQVRARIDQTGPLEIPTATS